MYIFKRLILILHNLSRNLVGRFEKNHQETPSLYGLNVIQASIINYVYFEVSGKIAYPFQVTEIRK